MPPNPLAADDSNSQRREQSVRFSDGTNKSSKAKQTSPDGVDIQGKNRQENVNYDSDRRRVESPDQSGVVNSSYGDDGVLAQSSSVTNTPAAPAAGNFGSYPYESGGVAGASAYGGMYGGGGMGGVMGGGMASPYGGYGGYGSPYGMMPSSGMMPGALSNLNQVLFSVQSVISSLGQAVQIIGMNTQALKQLVESISSMVDHTVSSWNEMQRIDAASRKDESEESKKKRRRLRAFRMAIVTAISYLGYRIIRRLFARQQHRQAITYGDNMDRGYPANYNMSGQYPQSNYGDNMDIGYPPNYNMSGQYPQSNYMGPH